MSLDLLKERARQEHPEFQGYYDLTDPVIKAFLIKSSSCWGTYSAKETECGICPLASECSKAKTENDELKAQAKAYREEHKDELAQEKVKKDLLKKIPPEILAGGGHTLIPQTMKEIESSLSKTPIPVGSKAYFIKGFGIISLDEAKTLGLAT